MNKTSKNKEIIEYSRNYLLENGFSPTFEEIASTVNCSKSHVNKIISNLKKEGKIITQKHCNKFIFSDMKVIIEKTDSLQIKSQG